MVSHIRQNTVIEIFKVRISAILFGHRSRITAHGIGLIIQFCRRSSESESDLPDNKLRSGITGIGVLACLQVRSIGVPVSQR